MTNFVYDADKNYLGTSSWLGSGRSFTTAELQEKYADGVYFRVVLRTMDQAVLTVDQLPETGVTFYAPGEEVPQAESAVQYTDIGSIGSWQDGAIFDGKLFALNGSGTGGVYDVTTAAKLASFTLDKADVLKPHANSVCFGSTYYAEGDKYPLLYINVYNNYKDAADRMEGTCCVYRLTEEDGAYTTELVQVIRIGFTEDLTLWKSKENNGDVRPYGNFVVDTDSDKLYAFTMRDADKTTRFFRFAIPALSEGDFSDAYGCNVVTLEAADIENRFDTAYFNYLQGCCSYGGWILSAEGFSSSAQTPTLRIVDLESQTLTGSFDLTEAGLLKEPEIVAVDPDTGKLYYAAADGMLRVLELQHTHVEVTDPALPPTCTETGLTEGSHCSVCGEVLVAQEEVPSTGHSFTVEQTDGTYFWYQCENCDAIDSKQDNHLKILLVGNSFSQDATWYEGPISHTYNLIKSMLDDDVQLTLGVAMSGGKSLAWHATNDRNGNAVENFAVVTKEGGAWEKQGSKTLSYAFEWTDWDVIVLQPYATEEYTGVANNNQGNYAFDEDLDSLEESIPYLLDQIQEHAPTAKAYYYLVWARGRQYATVEAALKATATNHMSRVEMAKTALTYTSTDGELGFADVVAIGTGIQNARSTYLTTLTYNVDAESNSYLNDPIMGLQRDSGHLSCTIGRYIAGLTVAKTVIPGYFMKENAVDAGPAPSQKIGAMPAEYVEIARKAVDAAMASPFAYTAIPGYESEPAAGLAALAEELAAVGTYTAEEFQSAVLAAGEGALSAAAMADMQLSVTTTCESTAATLTVTFGYTTKEVAFTLTEAPAHTYGDWGETTAPTATEHGVETRTCLCGDVETREIWPLGYISATAATLTDEELVLAEYNAVMYNKHMIFRAELDSLGDGTIRMGHGKIHYSSQYLEITATHLRVTYYFNDDTQHTYEFAHGLDISGWVDVRIDKGYGNADITITTPSGTYSKNCDWRAGNNGPVFCEATGVTLSNVDCRWWADEFDADIWLFGDSWFSMSSTARWPYYMKQDGHTDLLMSAYGGMGAASALNQFKAYLDFETPVYAVWCMGMNNGDYNGVINNSWLTSTQEFLRICEEKGIIPILATIPTTPKVPNEFKNAWVKASGYRYIDFDLAVVENHSTGDWFEGWAASDLNHPAALGAVALYRQAVADFPEITTGAPENCTHSLQAMGERTPDCDHRGRQNYYVCTLCGAAYADAEGQIETTTQAMLVAPLGHVEVTDPAVAATCTESGLTEGSHCSVCGEILAAQQVIEALGHDHVIAPAKFPTESETGLTEGRHCERCGEIFAVQTEVPALGDGAAVVLVEGSCGEDLFWSLDSYGLLTIYGEGKMKNFVSGSTEEWRRYLDNINDLVIEDSVTGIGAYAFENCTTLESVTVGTGISSSGSSAFQGCSGLTAVYITDIAQWCRIGFSGIYSNPVLYSKNLYINGELAAEIVIPDGITKIGSYAFHSCQSLEKITLSEDVTSIGYATFYGCSNLSEVVLPVGLTSIDRLAFYYCRKVNLTFAGDAPSIGYDAFLQAKATVYYPAHNATWTETIMQQYEGTLTWMGYGHDFGEWVEVVAPTCTERGEERRTCSCGHTESREVDALGHSEVTDPAVAPTCTETGLTEGKHCDRCGEIIVAQEVIEALGHSEVIDPAVAPTCTETGLTEGKHCDRCGEVLVAQEVVEALEHHYVDGICSVCGKSEPGTSVTPSQPVAPEPPVEPDEPNQPIEPEEPDQSEGAVVENPFIDTDEGMYYYNPVLWAVKNGITTGVTKTEFVPNGTCTREQVVTFLWRIAGCPTVEIKNPFNDVVKGTYSYDAILWAVANGITTGMSDPCFVPRGICTREQIVTFLWRAAGSPEIESENPFSDVSEDSYAYKAILWAVENGITNGVGGGRFAPTEVCTRADTVTFLYRAYGEESDISPYGLKSGRRMIYSHHRKR